MAHGCAAPEGSVAVDGCRAGDDLLSTVGIHVRLESEGRVYFAVSLGRDVQTLTRAMTTLLCRGLNGSTLEAVLQVPEDFIALVIGAELVRIRSRTVYYILGRMKEAARKLAGGGVK